MIHDGSATIQITFKKLYILVSIRDNMPAKEWKPTSSRRIKASRPV